MEKTKPRKSILLLVVSALTTVSYGRLTITSPKSTCYVETNLGGIYLQPLALKNGSPRFTNLLYSGPFQLTLLWNPCVGFTITDNTTTGNDCIDVEVADGGVSPIPDTCKGLVIYSSRLVGNSPSIVDAQLWPAIKLCVHISNAGVINRYLDPANSTQGKFLVNDDDVMALQYITESEMEPGRNLTVRIQMLCNESIETDTLVTAEESDADFYVLNLTSKVACYISGTTSPSTHQPLQPGFIVLIILCSVAAVSATVYLLVRFYKKSRHTIVERDGDMLNQMGEGEVLLG